MSNSISGVAIATVMDMPNCGGLCSHIGLLQKMLSLSGQNYILADGAINNKTFNQIMIAMKGLLNLQQPSLTWIKHRPLFIRRKLSKADIRFNVIHAHDPIAAVASFDLGYPVITTIHGPMSRHAREDDRVSESYIDVLKGYERKCYRDTSQFIAVDTGQRDILVEEGVPADRITVIPNAVDVDALRLAASKQQNREMGRYFILPRRLVPKNGTQIAVDAFLSWVGNRNVNLVVAGDGPLHGQLEAKISAHRNGRKVILLGMIPTCDIPTILSNSIATVIPSVPYKGVIEATSIAALEALALDVPVIASNIGGLAEIDGGSGLMSLVPHSDMAAIADQFEYWLDRQREERDTARSSYVRKNFGAQQWFDRNLQVYMKALSDATL